MPIAFHLLAFALAAAPARAARLPQRMVVRAGLLGTIALFSLAGCGPLLDGGVELQELCRDVDVREVPAATQPTTGTWSWSAEWTPPKLPAPDEAEIHVELDHVELIPGGGIDTLDFLENATVWIAKPDDAQLGYIAWTRPESGTVKRVTLRPPKALDLAELASSAPRVTTTLTGTLPTQTWSLTVRACYRATAKYAWGPL